MFIEQAARSVGSGNSSGRLFVAKLTGRIRNRFSRFKPRIDDMIRARPFPLRPHVMK